MALSLIHSYCTDPVKFGTQFSIFESTAAENAVREELMEAFSLLHSYCSDDEVQFYWNINTTIEKLLVQDVSEAKLRLRHAVINNNALFVAIYLRKHQQNQGDVNTIMDESKQSLIHWSTTAEMVHLVLSYGANLHHLAESGRTALHNCTTVEGCEALLLAGKFSQLLHVHNFIPSVNC